MRDLALLLIILTLVGLTLWRPWMGAVSVSVVGYLSPHNYGSPALQAFPAYLVVFSAASIGLLRVWWRGEFRPWLPRDWRVWGIALLWLWFVYTSFHSLAGYAAWPRMEEFSKSLLALALTLFLIENRKQLLVLMVAMALCFALVAAKGAYWTLLGGFTDRVYGPPGGHFSDNNLFAVAVVMILPLLHLWLRSIRQVSARVVVIVLMVLCVISVLSSWSRGAMLALVATGVMMLTHSRRTRTTALALLCGVALATSYLPESWFTRMGSIGTYQEDGSAVSRIEVWKTGLDYLRTTPLTGTGFDGWQHVTQGGLDWHSSYVEVLVEHGPLGLTLWFALLLGSLVSLTRLAGRAGNRPQLAWLRDTSQALRAALLAYGIGSLFLGITYWDLFFHMVVLSAVLTRIGAHEPLSGATVSTPESRWSAN